MSEQQELIRRGLHVQQLTSDINKSGPDERATGKLSKEVAGYLEICPSGTSPRVVEGYVKQFGGDKARIERAISELWEDHRGNVEDDWAPVVKKKGKKKETKDAPAGPLGGGRGRGGPGGLGGGRGRGRSAPPAGGRGGGRPTQRENGTPHLDSTGRGTSIGPTGRQAPQQRPKAEAAVSSGWSTTTADHETIPSRSSDENGGAETATSSTNAAETQPRRVVNAWARGAPHLSKPVPAPSETLNDASEDAAIKHPSSPKREKAQAGWNQKAPASPSKGQTADWPAKAGATWGTSSPSKKSPATVEPAEPVANRDTAGTAWGPGAAETGKKADWGVKSEPTGWATSGSPKRTAHVEPANAWGVKKDDAPEGAWSDRAPASTTTQSTPLAQPSAWTVKDKAPQPSGWGTTEKSVSAASQASAWGVKDKSTPPPPPGWGESKEQPSSLGGSSTWAAKETTPSPAPASTSAWGSKEKATTPSPVPQATGWGAEKPSTASTGWGEAPKANTVSKPTGWGQAPASAAQSGWGVAPASPKKATLTSAPSAQTSWGVKVESPRKVGAPKPEVVSSPKTASPLAVQAVRKEADKSNSPHRSPIQKPESPKAPQSQQLHANSPKQFLKMGKWDSLGTSESLEAPVLEFGSFSLEDTSLSPSLPASGTWGAAPVVSSSSGWGSAKAEAPSQASQMQKETLSTPVGVTRPLQQSAQKKTTNAPPGLSGFGMNPAASKLDQGDGRKEGTSHHKERGHKDHQQFRQPLDPAYQQYPYNALYPHPYPPQPEPHSKGTRTGSSTAGADSITSQSSTSSSGQSTSTSQAHLYQQQYLPPPPPGMAPYNMYNYGYNYQGNYGYYQTPQGFAPYNHPRGGMYQNPPRGSMGYVDPSYSNPSGSAFPAGYEALPQYGVPGFGNDMGYLHQHPHPSQQGGSKGQAGQSGSSTASSGTTGTGTAGSDLSSGLPSQASPPGFPSGSYGTQQQGYWGGSWGAPQPFPHQYHGYSGFDKGSRGGYDKGNKTSKPSPDM